MSEEDWDHGESSRARQREENERVAEADELRYLRRQVAVLAKKAEEEAKRAEEEAKRAEEEAKRAEEEAALRNGTYFSFFGDVWKETTETCNDGHYRSLFRNKIPDFKTRDGTGPQAYRITAQNAASEANIVKDDCESARTSHSAVEIKRGIWPCDVLTGQRTGNSSQLPQLAGEDVGNFQSSFNSHRRNENFRAPESDRAVLSSNVNKDDTENEDGQQPRIPYGDIAHLVPASPCYASLYFDVAKWVFGLSGDDVNAEVVQKLLHGCRKENEKKRVPHTGLKHMVSNKIRLKGQKDFYDESPFVLIVPIRTLEKAKEWNGEGYDALFMIDSRSRRQIDDVASAVGLTQGEIASLETATEDDVETARAFLESTLLALGTSLLTCRNLIDEQSNKVSFLTPKHRKIVRELSTPLMSGRSVKIPDVSQCDFTTVKIRKIHFASQFDSEGHPAPDPILLVVKAAYVWSKFHDQQLIAGGLIEGDDDDDDSETSLMAHNEFLEWRRLRQQENSDAHWIGKMIESA